MSLTQRVFWTYTRGVTVTLLNIIISVGDIFIMNSASKNKQTVTYRNYNTPRHLYNVCAAAAAA